MKRGLPERIFPLRLASANRDISGTLDGDELERLLQVVESVCDVVSVDLEFRSQAAGPATVTGRLATECSAICQRCLEPFSMKMEVAVHLLLAEDPDGARLQESLDIDSEWSVWEVDDEPQSLSALIEDELLLALPEFPMHEENDPRCDAEMAYFQPSADDAESDTPTEPENPFSVLAALKPGAGDDS
jgi:uncharacterized protein